jgi:hypothetical protein
MRDDMMNPYPPSPPPAPAESPTPEAPAAPADAAVVAPAVVKFKSCRWRCDPDDGEFCTHRDVLPFAGKNDFKPDSWCPECAFYKLRRTPKKRDWAAERANNY